MGRDKEMLVAFPYPGWTVVGYEWQLHISWKEESDKVVSFYPPPSGGLQAVANRSENVFGPYQLLSAKMNSYLDIFRLRRLISRLEKWLLEEYKSWVFKHVLGLE
jgi:hypothetical protein